MTDRRNRYAGIEFAGSIARLGQLPPDDGREVAVAGRSNAGKSSALNAIVGRRGLARVGKTPGRTRLINLFELGAGRRLVDLPGYGYARVPAGTRRGWEQLLTRYLARRRALAGIVLIVDARRGLTALDWRLIDRVGPARRPLHVLLTKADKLGRGEAARTLERVRGELEAGGVEASLQLFSATRGDGVADARGVLDAWLGWPPDKENPGAP